MSQIAEYKLDPTAIAGSFGSSRSKCAELKLLYTDASLLKGSFSELAVSDETEYNLVC